MNTQNIEFTLIQNALDSIERVMELLAWKEGGNEGSRLKQAILLTAHATELLLKERLRRIHPSLIWDDVDKYPKLDARTVGVDKAINRLKQIGNIALTDADSATVKALRNTRNAIEHFHWQTNRMEANSIVGKGLSFAIHFAHKELETDISYRFRDDDTWEQLLSQHSAFAYAHGVRIEQSMADQGKPVQECSFCNAMAQDLSTGACSLCGHWEAIEEDDPF
ncbi:MAG: hypothetical protein H6R07_3263 [Proteobacteria bacterium]|nr:hypothetical protein [Pseudomonadota bacterium]